MMFCFLIGNAQQQRSYYGPKTSDEQAQLYYGINPGFPSLNDVNTNKIKKTDAHPGNPVTIDPYQNEIAIPDYDNPGYTFESCPYMNDPRIIDNDPGNVSAYLYMKKKRIID